MAVAFDTLAFSEKLKAGGFDDRQAKAATEAFATATSQELATKADLAALATHAEIAELRIATKAELAELRLATKAEIDDLRLEISALESRLLTKLGAMIAAGVVILGAMVAVF